VTPSGRSPDIAAMDGTGHTSPSRPCACASLVDRLPVFGLYSEVRRTRRVNWTRGVIGVSDRFRQYVTSEMPPPPPPLLLLQATDPVGVDRSSLFDTSLSLKLVQRCRLASQLTTSGAQCNGWMTDERAEARPNEPAAAEPTLSWKAISTDIAVFYDPATKFKLMRLRRLNNEVHLNDLPCTGQRRGATFIVHLCRGKTVACLWGGTLFVRYGH